MRGWGGERVLGTKAVMGGGRAQHQGEEGRGGGRCIYIYILYIYVYLYIHIYTYKSKVAGVAAGGRNLNWERIPLAEGRPGV